MAYEHWRSSAESLLKPLAALMRPGKADLPLPGPASNHGPIADRLESFARPCLLAAHWLHSEPSANESLSRNQIADWFRQGLLLGTDPGSSEYWGPTANHHQHTVEMAALTLALQVARPALWEPYSPKERAQIAGWFASIRGAGLHRNNHMMFNVMTLAFLDQEGFGRKADKATSRFIMDTIESMSLGGGWFIDGMNETVDYYNAYAFHYYGLWWAKLYGKSEPARARRWKEWAAAFLKDYIHFFSTSGENPPFGRSICYRFAATAPFGLAEYAGVSAIPPGQARRACTRNLDFFLQKLGAPASLPASSEGAAQAQGNLGILSLGWTNEFPPIAEAYSCPGSVYWAAKAFAPLLLPPSHKFWAAPEKPLPSQASIASSDRPDRTDRSALAIPQAGLVVRCHEGDVELLNNANGICVANIKFGTWKWGKLSYRSGFGFEVARDEDHYPLDAALTAEFGNGSIMGRHQCLPLSIGKDHCGSVYGLGDRFSQNHVSVETRIWWKGGWQFHWHRIVAYQRALLRLGTYSLPIYQWPPTEASLADNYAFVASAERAVAIQPLLGFQRVQAHSSDSQRRTHLLAPHSRTLTAETDGITGEHQLIALIWAGASPQGRRAWSVSTASPGRIVLSHPTLEEWRIQAEGLPRVG